MGIGNKQNNMKKKQQEKQDVKKQLIYIKKLGEILSRIENATDSGDKEKANSWYKYLQGFIKAGQIFS